MEQAGCEKEDGARTMHGVVGQKKLMDVAHPKDHFVPHR